MKKYWSCRQKTITLWSRSNEMSIYVAATAQDKKFRRRIFLGTKKPRQKNQINNKTANRQNNYKPDSIKLIEMKWEKRSSGGKG